MNKEATAARIAENQISREAASAMWGSGSAYRRQMLSTPVPCPPHCKWSVTAVP
ncbi:hypothetical protein Q1M64_03745 (plasmid) [Sinorhizobium meliloti]|nr:hypothetical protein Q1M64_03745 [Sinorhizobium meliloti]